MKCSWDKLCQDKGWIIDGDRADTLAIFAHGAGANMSHEFMETMAQDLAGKGIQVLRFNFPYMQANLVDGKRRPPDRAPKLLAHFREQLELAYGAFEPKRIVLIGKSMGGRMASILSEDSELMNRCRVSHLICLGYPFVPLKGGEPRLEPLQLSSLPILVIQGERDKFGTQENIESWDMPESVQCRYLTDGDHSFKPRKVSGTSIEANMAQAVAYAVEFIKV